MSHSTHNRRRRSTHSSGDRGGPSSGRIRTRDFAEEHNDVHRGSASTTTPPLPIGSRSGQSEAIGGVNIALDSLHISPGARVGTGNIAPVNQIGSPVAHYTIGSSVDSTSQALPGSTPRSSSSVPQQYAPGQPYRIPATAYVGSQQASLGDGSSMADSAGNPPMQYRTADVGVPGSRQVSNVASQPLQYRTNQGAKYALQQPTQAGRSTGGTQLPDNRNYDPSNFKYRGKKFFETPGRVFVVIWSESAGAASGTTFTNFTPGSHGTPVLQKPRFFVALHPGKQSCWALAISTHRGQGVVNASDPSDHGIAYHHPNDMWPLEGEEGMQPTAIRILPDLNTETLRPRSRINYSKVYTVEYNVKVRPFGMVQRDHMEFLIDQFEAVSGVQLKNIKRVHVPAGRTAVGPNMPDPQAIRSTIERLKKHSHLSEEAAVAAVRTHLEAQGLPVDLILAQYAATATTGSASASAAQERQARRQEEVRTAYQRLIQSGMDHQDAQAYIQQHLNAQSQAAVSARALQSQVLIPSSSSGTPVAQIAPQTVSSGGPTTAPVSVRVLSASDVQALHQRLMIANRTDEQATQMIREMENQGRIRILRDVAEGDDGAEDEEEEEEEEEEEGEEEEEEEEEEQVEDSE